MSEWQPIETAPKNGTRILAWLEDADDMNPQIIVFCGGEGESQEPDWRLAWDFERLDGEAFGKPTYWQPLPTPPTHTKGHGK